MHRNARSPLDYGMFGLGVADSGGQLLGPMQFIDNQLQWGWGEILCRLLGYGDQKYKIAGFYIEFENLADIDDPITPPDYAADEGIAYYEALSTSPGRDFLRVPLTIQPGATLVAGYEDAGITMNQLTWMAYSTGTVGVHGKAFASESNSKVFGIALVAAPVWSDRTRDLVFARAYYPESKQMPKPSTGQVTVSYVRSFR